MGASEHNSIDEIRETIAAARKRIADAISDDDEATRLLERAFPADWGDAPIAVVWLLGNAARFATGDGDGFSAAVAEAWLDRLVDKHGNPRERGGALADAAHELLADFHDDHNWALQARDRLDLALHQDEGCRIFRRDCDKCTSTIETARA